MADIEPMTYFHVPGIGRDDSYECGDSGSHGASADGYVPLKTGDIATIDLKGPKPRRYRVRAVEFYADARGRAETGLHIFLQKIEGEDYEY